MRTIADGFAEVDGNVYFRTEADDDYGVLGKYTNEEMIAFSHERGADPG
ncbi:MAG: hypothetical protein R2849_00680 [Thermomicrobiales bacterium]